MSSGDELALRQRGGVYEIRCNGWDLMSNRAHASEEALAQLALGQVKSPTPRILIGGLGMGFTLRAALNATPQDACVDVAEIAPEIIAWNRGLLTSLHDRALEDVRVRVHVNDVADLLAANSASFHAVLLDIDNGPDAVMYEHNAALYSRNGLRLALSALAPEGVLAFWSAGRSAVFETLLNDAKTIWRVIETPAQKDRAMPLHAIYLVKEPA